MKSQNRSPLDLRPAPRDALAARRPVVVLESTVFAHGLPRPQGVETALRMEEIVREAGAVPATVGLLDGRLVVGLQESEIRRLGESDDVAKVSTRDLGAVIATGGLGATTVAGTLVGARLAGIRVMATGGLGGVHRGGESSLDVSADLTELARSPVAVVCSGAKAVLDLERTLEVLETSGVPVVGYGTSELPAFYSRESGLGLEARADSPEEAADLLAAHWGLGLPSGVVVANPPPEDSALPAVEVERWIGSALAEAEQRGIVGGAVTPFLLGRVAELSEGRSLGANIALLESNALTAARVAIAVAAG